MFCGNCGNKLADGDVFCSECGTKADIPVQVENKEEADFDKTVIAQPEEEATQIAPCEAPPESETEVAPQSAPALDFSAVRSPLFCDDNSLLDSAPVRAMPEEEAQTVVSAPETQEDATVMMPAAEEATEIMADKSEEPAQMSKEEQATDFAQSGEEATVLLSDDSYNVYSGAVPGVSSQDFRYPTNDNAYPDLPTEMSPAFDPDATQGFDYSAQANAPSAEQAYNNPYENYPPEQAYAPEVPPKKKNTAMWIIIICLSVVIVALGASCAVILTQYDSFEDFFASFSDEKNDDEDDGDRDKKKDKNKTTVPAETTEPTTVEPTTEEPTTAPRAYDGYCGMQLMYDFDEATGRLMIFGTGEMNDYSNVTTPWSELNVTQVIVEEGVTSVTAGAFSEISPSSISVSSTVASFDVLAVDAFGAINVSPSNLYYASSNGVLFDKSMTQLIAYPNMSVSTSYAVPDSVKWIGEYAFYKSTNLNYLILGSSVEFIGDYAFKDCYNIRSFELPASVTEVRTGVFSGWVQSQNIRIMNPETQAVSDWDEGCGASVVIG